MNIRGTRRTSDGCALVWQEGSVWYQVISLSGNAAPSFVLETMLASVVITLSGPWCVFVCVWFGHYSALGPMYAFSRLGDSVCATFFVLRRRHALVLLSLSRARILSLFLALAFVFYRPLPSLCSFAFSRSRFCSLALAFSLSFPLPPPLPLPFHLLWLAHP